MGLLTVGVLGRILLPLVTLVSSLFFRVAGA
jgi:hypothetical protein